MTDPPLHPFHLPAHLLPWGPLLNGTSSLRIPGTTHVLSSPNITATPHYLMAYFPSGFKTACFILAGVIALLNGVVIVAYALSVRVRRTTSLFLLNLAIVDFQNGCVSLPLVLMFPRSDLEESPNGSVLMCVMVIAWPQILFIVAFQSVLVVTVERFICVTKPYTRRKLLQKPRCIAVISAIWIFAACFSLMPTLTYNRITSRGSVLMCDGAYQQGVVYLHVFLYGLLATPVVLIVLLYLLMYRVARKHTLNIQKLHNRNEDGNKQKKQRQIIQTSRAAKTVGLLSSFYLVCWLPFLILLQVSELCKLGECPGSVSRESLQRATPVTVFLAFLGCALNPVIYIFRTRALRHSCWVGLARCNIPGLKQPSSRMRTSFCTDGNFNSANYVENAISMTSLNNALARQNHRAKYTMVPS
jgi:hypothetical protein